MYILYTEVSADDREEIRDAVEQSDNNIIPFTSYGTFSTGININKLDNITLLLKSKTQPTTHRKGFT